MKLFYIDRASTNEEIKEFFPRISENRMSEEDSVTPRICVSTSIEGCLSAAPWGGNSLNDLGKAEILRVYEFDSDEVMEGNLITSQELFDKKLVPDALITSEYWIINQCIKPINTYYILLYDYSSKDIPYNFNDSTYSQKKIYNIYFDIVGDWDICFDKEIKVRCYKNFNNEIRRELLHTLYTYCSKENYGVIKIKKDKGKINISLKESFGYSYEILMSEIEEVINGLY